MAVSDYVRKNRVVSQAEASSLRELAIRQGRDIVLSDPVDDEIWARGLRQKSRPSNYFDYYFTGQDIKVRVAEVPETDPQFGDLPLLNFAFNIEQEKQPVYGYWDYTYAAVMRGTRLISGAFSIATKYPDFMKDLLATAASNRANKNLVDALGYSRALTSDDKNIEQWWGTNMMDPGLGAGGRNLFSSHPPFNFIIIYGVQPVSVPGDVNGYQQFYNAHYANSDNVILTDENHRLVESDPSFNNRIIIDAVELKSCQQSYTPDGALCMETYSFFARDAVVPPQIQTDNVQPVTSGGPNFKSLPK
jgi:hypothetical protein